MIDTYIPFCRPDRWYTARSREYLLDAPWVSGGVHTGLYHRACDAFFAGEIDWVTDDIRVMLSDSFYDAWPENRYLSDTSGEVCGVGYRTGGASLTGRSVFTDLAGARVFDADDVVWPSATLSAGYAVVYKDSGDPATSPLISYVSFSAAVTVTAGTFTITWGSGGVLRIEQPGVTV